MKKIYIFLSSIAVVSAVFAQAPTSVPSGSPVIVSAKSKSSNVFIDNDAKIGGMVKPKANKTTITSRGANLNAFIRIGSTYYDLQSNYAMAHRVVVHKDQAVSAGWTSSYSGAQGFPGRGTGYNYKGATDNWGKSDTVVGT